MKNFDRFVAVVGIVGTLAATLLWSPYDGIRTIINGDTDVASVPAIVMQDGLIRQISVHQVNSDGSLLRIKAALGQKDTL